MQYYTKFLSLFFVLGFMVLASSKSAWSAENNSGTVGNMSWEISYSGKNRRGNAYLYKCIIKDKMTEKLCINHTIVWIDDDKANRACQKMADHCDRKAAEA